MLKVAIGLFALAIIAALLGMDGVSGLAATLAQVSLLAYLILAISDMWFRTDEPEAHPEVRSR